MFYGLKKQCVLLLFGEMFYIFQLDAAGCIVQIFYLPVDFLSSSIS